jgi:3-methyladenine DNA glycosylase AlkD
MTRAIKTPLPQKKSRLPLLTATILAAANPVKGEFLQKFFKTGPGQYAEGDIFLGITVPAQRTIAKQFPDLPLSDLDQLITSKYHEFRLIALLILCQQAKQARRLEDLPKRKEIFDFYLAHTAQINNWDLVDLSAPEIVGHFLLERPRKILYKLVKSKNLWERRIAVLATFPFIKNKDFTDVLKISELLLKDQHDLMHKAVGWMLREVGKKDRTVLDQFLRDHYHEMPRTTLRYAIEHYPESERQKFLKGLI